MTMLGYGERVAVRTHFRLVLGVMNIPKLMCFAHYQSRATAKLFPAWIVTLYPEEVVQANLTQSRARPRQAVSPSFFIVRRIALSPATSPRITKPFRRVTGRVCICVWKPKPGRKYCVLAEGNTPVHHVGVGLSTLYHSSTSWLINCMPNKAQGQMPCAVRGSRKLYDNNYNTADPTELSQSHP